MATVTYTIQPVPVYGTPVAGTDEVQTLTIGGTPTGGTFRLAFQGHVTGAIAWSSTNNTLRDNVDAALEALPVIGTGGVTVAVGTMTAGIGTLTLTFAGPMAKRVQPLITVLANYMLLTGTEPTVAVAETTPGVNPTGVGIVPNGVIADVSTGTVYYNAGTATHPTWTEVA